MYIRFCSAFAQRSAFVAKNIITFIGAHFRHTAVLSLVFSSFFVSSTAFAQTASTPTTVAPVAVAATIVQAATPSASPVTAPAAPQTVATEAPTLIEKYIEKPVQQLIEKIHAGRASYYADAFHGRKTATGEVFDMNQISAASNKFPLGTWLAVRRPENGQCITLRVNDRMAARTGNMRIMDLSRAAAERLGMIAAGISRVEAKLMPEGFEKFADACDMLFPFGANSSTSAGETISYGGDEEAPKSSTARHIKSRKYRH